MKFTSRMVYDETDMSIYNVMYHLIKGTFEGFIATHQKKFYTSQLCVANSIIRDGYTYEGIVQQEKFESGIYLKEWAPEYEIITQFNPNPRWYNDNEVTTILYGLNFRLFQFKYDSIASSFICFTNDVDAVQFKLML